MQFKTLLVPLAVIGAAALLAACSPVTALNAVVPSKARTQAGVSYGPDERHKLDIYIPVAAAPREGHPLVVFFYGGSWNEGERGDYKFIGESLAGRGIVTLVADYRLYPQVRYPEFLHDSARALQYGLREARALGADPRRVFVMGHSSGGYNAAMMALDSRWLSAGGAAPDQLAGWIGLAGPYDFLPIVNPDVKPVFHHPDYPPNTQPLAFAGASSPPAFIGAAREDKLVNPQRNSVQMAQRLEAAGVPVTLRLYEHASHVTLAGAFAWPLRWIAPVLDDVSAFIDRTAPSGLARNAQAVTQSVSVGPAEVNGAR
jgi:acetyl esterase/lipase